MRTPLCLIDVILVTESAYVLTVPSPENTTWVQDGTPKTIINTGFVSDAPTVPCVPKEYILPQMNQELHVVKVEDVSTDPVIAAFGIQGVAIFDLAIPHHSYNGMVLLELIEKHSGENINENDLPVLLISMHPKNSVSKQ